MTKRIGIVFPGQGSQSLGMLKGLAQAHRLVTETFEQASDALGFDLWKMVQDGPDTALNETHNTQPAMLAADVAVYRLWVQQGGAAGELMAGHSLGEYSALVAAGSLGFSDAVKLVAQRGRFMQESVPEGQGAMAAILGLDDTVVKELCAQGSANGVVEAVNFNSPGQVVIAGEKKAVEDTIERAKTAGARRALLLPVSVPSHCSLMQPAAQRLAQVLDAVALKMPRVAVIHNVNVAIADSVEAIRQCLVEQLYRPVRWVETIEKMKADGMELLLEAGPGKVLTGLGKRIDKTLTTLPVFDPASLEKALESCHA